MRQRVHDSFQVTMSQAKIRMFDFWEIRDMQIRLNQVLIL